MNRIICELSSSQKFKNYLKNIQTDVTPIVLSGLTDVCKNVFSVSTEELLKKPICIVTYNEIQAKNILKDIKSMLKNNEKTVAYFPKREILSYDYEAQSKDVYAERIETLNKIYSKNVNIIVTTIEAVSQKMLSKEVLYKNVLNLKIGRQYNLESLKQTLLELGYERFDLIEGKGQFGVRGGIVDVAISREKGVRVEFFDDEIDSIRYFDISSQRSTEMIEEITIYPAYEFILERSLEEIVTDIKISKNLAIKKRQEEDIEEIISGEYISKVDKYFNAFYKKQQTILEYLDNEYIIFLDEIEKIKARIENINNDTENVIKLLIEKERIVPDALKTLGNFYEFYGSNLKNNSILDKKIIVHLLREEVIGEKEAIFNRKLYNVDNLSPDTKKTVITGISINEKYTFKTKELNFYRSTIELFIQEVQNAVQNNKKILILNETQEAKVKVINLLEDNKITGNIECIVGNLNTGVEIFDFNLMIITTKNLFEKKKERRKFSTEFKEGQHIIADDLKVGDFVVHKNQGIAQFIGINTITADNVTKDYVKLKFADERNIVRSN